MSVAAVLIALAGAPADAAVGPGRLQRLAQAQTAQLLNTYVAGQLVSPAGCQNPRQLIRHGVTLLPTLSFAIGDATVTCRLESRRVLLDLGSAVATEDATGNTYTTTDGRELTFARRNLEAICDDLLPFLPSGAATLDGKPITTGVAVSTAPVVARGVGPEAGQFHADSVALGHPGRLAASSCGWKAELELRPGYHEIVVDLSAPAGAPTTLTYRLWVDPHG